MESIAARAVDERSTNDRDTEGRPSGSAHDILAPSSRMTTTSDLGAMLETTRLSGLSVGDSDAEYGVASPTVASPTAPSKGKGVRVPDSFLGGKGDPLPAVSLAASAPSGKGKAPPFPASFLAASGYSEAP